MKKFHFEIFKGKNGDWYFHLKASNGKLTLQSEGYKTRAACKRTVVSMIEHIAFAEIR